MSLAAFFTPASVTRKASHPFRTVPRCMIAGVPVHRLRASEAVAAILDAVCGVADRPPLLIMGPNAHLVTLAQRDRLFQDALLASSLNIPDGISVVLASRLLGAPIPERVPGGELMEHLCQGAAKRGLTVFLLGGLPDAAKLAAATLQRRYPALSIAGTYCPPRAFEQDPMECAHIRQLITETAPDLLFVAFGAPRQEMWMHENCPTLPIRAAMSVGAAFDTLAGLRKRAPRWTHRLGLEWLYRLLHEPRRLWRRYLIGNVYFVFLVLRDRFLYGRSQLHLSRTGAGARD